MKKILITIIILLLNNLLFSQIAPFSRHYLFDQSLINPAFGAKYDYFTIKLMGADQWTALPQNPKIATLMLNYKFAKKKMGINTAIFNNTYGLVQFSGIKFSYFYYSKVNVEGDYFSLGIYGSLFNHSFNISQATTEINNDPALSVKKYSKHFVNAGFGGIYNQKYFTLSMSFGNVIPTNNKTELYSFKPPVEPNLYLYADLKLANEIKTFIFIPSIMFRINTKLSKEINLNGKMMFNQKLWFAISYRDALTFELYSIHNINFLIGLRFLKRFEFGYSYDIGILSARNIYGGTHSLYLGFYMIKKNHDLPMFF